MKRLVIIGLLLSTLVLNFLPIIQAADAKEQIDSLARKYLKNNSQAGLVVGIINGDKKWVFGYGKISSANPVIPDSKTLFEIGSITKTFTALLSANLTVQGIWNLNDPVKKYLPEITFPDFKGQDITLRHLLNHTSGLPGVPSDIFGKDFDKSNPYKTYTKQRMLQFISSYKLKRAPGTMYEYSNLGFGLLGVCLEKVTGKDYEKLLVETICNPLNLSNTRIGLTDEQKKYLAIGHSTKGKETSYWDFDAMDSAGAIKSNVNDLLIYTQVQMSQVESDLKNAAAICHPFDYEKGPTPIALSWHGLKNKEIWWHNGGTGGFSCFLAFTKSTPKAVVILASSENFVDELGISVLEINVSGLK